jgi:hypothetical protein
MRCVALWWWGDVREVTLVWVGGRVEVPWQRSVSRFAGERVMSEELSVTTRNVSKQANALAKARETPPRAR